MSTKRPTPKERFQVQRWTAIVRRNIPFTLTYEEWWDIWEKSGHWEERGRGAGKYVMSRIGDKGGYEVGNVLIQTSEQHSKDTIGSPRTYTVEEILRRKSFMKTFSETNVSWNKGLHTGVGKDNSMYGKTHSDETKKRMSEKALGRKRSLASIAKGLQTKLEKKKAL